MTLGEAIRLWWGSRRAFVPGAAVVASSDSLFGHDDSAWSPSEYGDYIATSNPVYACAILRAELVAGTPLKVMTVGDEPGEVTSGPARRLLDGVNPFWTLNRLLSMTELSLSLWGEAYLMLERGTGGPPRELWWARPDRVQVLTDPEAYIRGFELRSPMSADAIRFEPDEVIWLRYPNPMDEFSGLAPLAAARLAADVASAAMKSNYHIFDQGLTSGGAVFPPENPKTGIAATLTDAQRDEIAKDLAKRFKGTENAHRWAVFKHRFQMEALDLSPKDAEFLGALRWSLEDVCRAFRIPLDLMGGERTYENVGEARRMLWTNFGLPELQFIAAEFTEQLAPLFGGGIRFEFDTSGVPELQEGQTDAWERARGQITIGAITINEWRTDQGLEPVPWGDEPKAVAETPTPEPPPEPARAHRRALEYGGAEHRALIRAFNARTEPLERPWRRELRRLFQRQRQSVLDKLREGVDLDGLWNSGQWRAAGEALAEPLIRRTMLQGATDTLETLPEGRSIVDDDPAAKRFILKRAQRFAQRIDETTWGRLRKHLAEGMDAGEGVPELADRVETVMGDRIRSSPEVIARTEVIGAYNGGSLWAAKRSDIVVAKVWVTALDERVRASHLDAHGQERSVNEDFNVGSASGPAPGQMGEAREDIQCRCTMTYKVKFG